MSGFGLRAYAEEMHALAVEICDYLNASGLHPFAEEVGELVDLQQFAQTFGDLFDAEDQEAAIRSWLDHARARLEAAQQGGAS